MSRPQQPPQPTPTPTTDSFSSSTAELYYGKAFLFRCDHHHASSSSWVGAADESLGGALQSTALPAPTSLLTMHSSRADPVNYAGQTTAWQAVHFDAVVTLYANVGRGRYLDHGSSSLRFRTSPRRVRADEERAAACEFIVRRAARGGTKGGRAVRLGDGVRLECASQPPGRFLCRDPNSTGQFVLSSLVGGGGGGGGTALGRWWRRRSSLAVGAGGDVFHVCAPTLAQLLQFQRAPTNAHAAPPHSIRAHSTASSTNKEEEEETNSDDSEDSDGDFLSASQRHAVQQERAVWRRMASTLPEELVRKVLEYKPDYVRTARLCCKAWQLQAERDHVRRIRVNGELYSFDEPGQRDALVRFVLRCTKVTRLTLRNILALGDEDVARLCANSSLEHLILGGCRYLTDRSVEHIARLLPRLRTLNLAQTAVTDRSLRRIVWSMPQVEDVNLYNCAGVTAEGINAAGEEDQGEGVIRLVSINVRGSIAQYDAVRRFSQRHPHVQVLTGPATTESIYG